LAKWLRKNPAGRRWNKLQALALAFKHRRRKEQDMPGKSHGGHIKNKDKYEALKSKGMSKTRAAKIANSGKAGSKKGGRHSHSKH